MSRIVYVNGAYRPYSEALVHVEDRGFQFADAVYEVIEVLAGSLVDATRHLDRLERSLRELEMVSPMGRPALLHVIGETLSRNRVQDGLVYLQVTRGTAPRDFLFPPLHARPTVIVIARGQSQTKIAATAEDGIAVISSPDIRWGRCDIKTVMLLPACLAKNQARNVGAKEAWFVDGSGFVTEGASSNAWLVSRDGTLITREADQHILGGVTRATLLDLLKAENLRVEQRPFTLDEAKNAAEAFLTAATNTIMPVVRIDETQVGNGKPGPVTRRLRSRFHELAEVLDP